MVITADHFRKSSTAYLETALLSYFKIGNFKKQRMKFSFMEFVQEVALGRN